MGLQPKGAHVHGFGVVGGRGIRLPRFFPAVLADWPGLPRGKISLSTVMDETLIDSVVQRCAAAMEDVAEEVSV